MVRAVTRVALLAFFCLPLTAQEKSKTSCIARNTRVISYNRETKKTTESEDWFVDCIITVGDKQILKTTLPLLHPATFHEVMGAIDEFRNKKAPQIVADYKKK